MDWTIVGLTVACCGWAISVLKNTEQAYKLKVTEQQLRDTVAELARVREAWDREGEEWKYQNEEE